MKKGRKALGQQEKFKRLKENYWNSNTLNIGIMQELNLINSNISSFKLIQTKPTMVSQNKSKIKQVKKIPQISVPQPQNQQPIIISSDKSIICVNCNVPSEFLDSDIYEQKTESRPQPLPNYLRLITEPSENSSINLSQIPIEQVQQFMSDDISIEKKSICSLDSMTPLPRGDLRKCQQIQYYFPLTGVDEIEELLQENNNEMKQVINILSKTNPNKRKKL